MPSIKRNFIYKLLYEILAIAAPLIIVLYASYTLGAEDVGIYTVIISVSWKGLDQITTRKVRTRKAAMLLTWLRYSKSAISLW